MQSEDLIKYKLGVNWQLIFFHNSTGRVFFEKNSSDLLFCNKSQQFSNLGILTNNYKTKGFFEFLIEYPEFDYLIHWKQRKNPIKFETDIGFVPLHVPSNKSPFRGLALSQSSYNLTFLEGNIDSNDWFYSIGYYSSWPKEEYFPGPCFYDDANKYIGTSLVYLYVRVRKTMSCKRSKGFSFNKLHIIVIILVS